MNVFEIDNRPLKADFQKCLLRACAYFEVEPEDVLSNGKKPLVIKARYCTWFSLYRLGYTMNQIAQITEKHVPHIRYGIDRAAGCEDCQFVAEQDGEMSRPVPPDPAESILAALARHDPAERLNLTLVIDGRRIRYKSVMKPSGWAWEKDDFDYQRLKGNNYYGNNCTY